MANLTLSLDSELLQKARELALQERTSVNRLVRDYLIRYVEARSRRFAALSALDELAADSDARSAGERWSRDELHQR